jgi:hypothetical protein
MGSFDEEESGIERGALMPRRDKNPATAEKAPANLVADRQDRYRQAAALLRQWREDDSGYDEKFWPLLEEEFSLSIGRSKSRS